MSNKMSIETDVYQALTTSQRESFLASYLQHLQRRNGDADLKRRQFSVREKFFLEIEDNPVHLLGSPLDQGVFTLNEERRVPQPGLDEVTLWALAVAKANRTERDGVEYALERIDPATRKPENPLTYIEIEEFYHTRVLKDILSVVGIEMRQLPPHPLTSTMVKAMYHLPRYISNVAIFCAELAGVASFRLLADKAQELFSDQPRPLKRINDLFQQILVDEVGHVHYVRSQLGAVRLGIAKKILPVFSEYFMSDMPEFKVLFGEDKLREKILLADVHGATAMYEDRFIPVYVSA